MLNAELLTRRITTFTFFSFLPQQYWHIHRFSIFRKNKAVYKKTRNTSDTIIHSTQGVTGL